MMKAFTIFVALSIILLVLSIFPGRKYAADAKDGTKVWAVGKVTGVQGSQVVIKTSEGKTLAVSVGKDIPEKKLADLLGHDVELTFKKQPPLTYREYLGSLFQAPTAVITEIYEADQKSEMSKEQGK